MVLWYYDTNNYLYVDKKWMQAAEIINNSVYIKYWFVNKLQLIAWNRINDVHGPSSEFSACFWNTIMLRSVLPASPRALINNVTWFGELAVKRFHMSKARYVTSEGSWPLARMSNNIVLIGTSGIWRDWMSEAASLGPFRCLDSHCRLDRFNTAGSRTAADKINMTFY